MKNFFTSGLGIMLLISVVYILYLTECKSTKCPPKGMILLKQSVWDSAQALANKPPKIDTVHEKGKIVYVSQTLPVAKPEPKDSTINNYDTTLVKKDTINVRVKLKVKGILLKWDWFYTPEITTITIKEYVPNIINNPVPTPQRGLYLYGMLGGNENIFIPSGGVDIISKKNMEYGFMYQRYGKQNFYHFKLGTKITFSK